MLSLSRSTNSSSRKEAEDADVTIAQNAVPSRLCAVLSVPCIRRSTVTVIGNRVLVGLPPMALCLRMPSITRFNRGSDDWSRGGGRPSEICMLRTAAKYLVMDWGANPSLAKADAK